MAPALNRPRITSIYFCFFLSSIYPSTPVMLNYLFYNLARRACSARRTMRVGVGVGDNRRGINRLMFGCGGATVQTSISCTHPLEQAPRQASPSKRHCSLSAAAEITFVFNFVIPPSPHPHPIVQFPMSSFPYCHTHSPPFHLLCQAQRAWISLHGVRLRSTSGHWH